MTIKKNALAIIPARGGSKRFPRKNLYPLSGRPLISWSIDAAIDSKIFDEVIVNTDDNEIAEVSKKSGAQVPFLRPDYLATDTASSIDVIRHTIEWYKTKKNIEFATVALLQPTSPLRNVEDIQLAYSLFQQKKAASVLSVCKVDHPTAWCNTLDETLSMNGFIKEKQGKSRSQDYEQEYRLNGAIYIWDVAKLLCNGTTVVEPSYAAMMPRSRSIDIDEKLDLEIAQVMMSC